MFGSVADRPVSRNGTHEKKEIWLVAVNIFKISFLIS